MNSFSKNHWRQINVCECRARACVCGGRERTRSPVRHALIHRCQFYFANFLFVFFGFQFISSHAHIQASHSVYLYVRGACVSLTYEMKWKKNRIHTNRRIYWKATRIYTQKKSFSITTFYMWLINKWYWQLGSFLLLFLSVEKTNAPRTVHDLLWQ